MKKRTLNFLFVFVITLLFFTSLFAQNGNGKLKIDDIDQTHIVILKSGKRINGKIKSIENENVFIQSLKSDTLLQFTLSDIKKIKIKGNLSILSQNFDEPYMPTLSLFFTNTTFAMKKGERSYRTFWGNSMVYSKQFGDGFEGGIGYSFPVFLNAFFKATGTNKNNTSRHGFKLSAASSPITTIDDDELSLILEVSQMNTWGNTDRFINLTFNYYEIKLDGYFFDDKLLQRYASIAVGGGIRITEKVQFHINKNINFNLDLLDFNLMPSFGLNWNSGKHNIGFGYMSNNEIGFNFYPLFDTNFNDFIIMEKGVFAKLPFFSYSRIF